MERKNILLRLFSLIFLILLSLFVTACASEADIRSRVWFDFPTSGREFKVGESIIITAHLYAKDGVNDYCLQLDGKEIARESAPNPGETLVAIQKEWIPTTSGQHTITLIQYDANLNASSKGSVHVNVVETSSTPEPEIITSKSPEATETGMPTPTWTKEPTWTREPTNPPAPATPTATEPPPPDTTPPSISNLAASPDPIVEAPCTPNSVTISASVSDNTGLSEVKLYYRIVKGGQNGAWQTPVMNANGGGKYQVTLGPSQMQASMQAYGGSIVQFYVKAWDSAGNVAETSSGNVQVQVCVE